MAAVENLENAVRATAAQYHLSKNLSPHIKVSDGEFRDVSLKQHQIAVIPETHSIAVITPIATQTSFNGQNVDFRIIKGSVQLLEDFVAQMQITETSGANSVTPTNPWFFFQYIELWGNAGNDKVQTLYPEQMLHHFGAFMTDEQQKRIANNNNFTLPNYQNESALPASGTYGYMTPILGNFFAQNNGIFIPGLGDDFLVRVWLRSGIVKSGSGTIGLTKIQLQTETRVITGQEYDEYAYDYKGIVEIDYLDTTRFTISQAFAAGSQTKIQLSPIIGWASYFFYVLRVNNSSVANDAIMKFETQGTGILGALVEIDSPSGIIISGNVPFYADYLLNIESGKHFPGKLHRFLNMYPLVFGDPMAAESKVIHKGFLSFTGNEFINLTPSSAGVAETPELQTITPFNPINSTATAASAGNTAISVSGYLPDGTYISGSTKTYIFNAAILTNWGADLQTIFNQYPGYAGQPITVAVTGNAFNNTAGITITLSNLPLGWVSGSINFYATNTTLTNGTVVLVGNTVVTTPGVAKTGFTNATLNLDVYARMFRHAHINKGRFEVFSIRAQ